MNYKIWTEEENALLKEKAGKFSSYEEISSFFPGRTAEGLKSHARTLGIKNPNANAKYNYNRDYFYKPNYMNCFFAGILAADGCVFDRRGAYRDLTWTLESKDRGLLEIFKKELNYNGEIYDWFNSGEKYKNKKGENHSRIHLHTLRQMGIDLEVNFNIVPNKTLRLGPPNLKDIELKLAYLVGFINGDGCIAFSEKRGPTIRIGGAGIGLLKWCSELFYDLKIRTPRHRKPNVIYAPGTSNCYLFIISNVAAMRMYELLKLVPVPILERKWVRPEIDAYIAEKKLKHPEYFSESIDSILARNNINFSKTF